MNLPLSQPPHPPHRLDAGAFNVGRSARRRRTGDRAAAAARSAATKRYAASCMAMALIVVAAGVTFEVSGQAPSPPSARNCATRAPLAPSPQLSAASAPLPIALTPPATPHRTVLDDVVILWSAGVVVIALRHLGGWLWLLRLRRGSPLPRYEPRCETSPIASVSPVSCASSKPPALTCPPSSVCSGR